MKKANVPDFISHDEGFDLREYWRILDRYKWRIMALALAVSMLTAMVVFSITPTYQATATLMIEAEPIKPTSIEEVYGLDSTRSEYFLTQFEILKSKSIAERVVQRLNLTSHPEFDPDQQAPSLMNRMLGWLPFMSNSGMLTTEELERLKYKQVVDAFANRLTVSPVKGTQLVNLTFESASPTLAADAANAVAEVFVESQRDDKVEVTHMATGWLNSRLDDLRKQLEESEAALQAFKESEGLIDVEGVRGLSSQELNEITTQLVMVRRELKQAATLRDLVRANRDDFNVLSSLPEVSNHAVIQDVKQAEVEAARRVSELARRYGPKHPQMIAARDQLESVVAKLHDEVRQLVTGIESDYRVELAKERALVQQLTDAKNDFQRITRKEGRFDELKREVDVNTQLYSAFLTRFKETNEIAGFEVASARLIDPAVAPFMPAKPEKKLIVAIALILSVGVGIFLAFMMEALNDNVRSLEDVEQKIGQHMVGLLPWVPHKKKARLGLRTFFDVDQFEFSEAVRSMRTSFVLSGLDSSAKIVSVTSSIPGEGKTTVAENLAFSLAQMEKVLLIDADMRHPTIGKDFGLPLYRPGLSNLISGTATMINCIHKDTESGLHVMPAGSIPPNPQELLASPRFVEALKDLAENYDRIVIDTAPAHVVSDALVLSRIVDSTLYVVKADSTRQKVIRAGIGRLLQVGGKLDGVVLNQVDTTSKSTAYGENYGYYSRGYGYGYENAKARENMMKDLLNGAGDGEDQLLKPV